MDEKKTITAKQIREGRRAVLLTLLPLLRKKHGRPATLREMANALALGEGRITLIRNDLIALTKQGKLREVTVPYGERKAYEVVVDEQATAE